MSNAESVKRYLAEGWSIIPIPKGEKGPRIENWQKLTFTEADFKPTDNIGVKLGEPSGGLVDVDLDCKEAIIAAKILLPKTGRIHGRPGKPRSHYWYFSPGMKAEQFKDLDGSMLVEIRSTGGQTVLPPSKHPSGEILGWEILEALLRLDHGPLRDAVVWNATAAICARHWPEQGGRHAAAGLLAGLLLTLKVPPPAILPIIEATAAAAGDPEVKDRLDFAQHTITAYLANEPVAGGPKLADLIGADVVKRIRAWYGTAVSMVQELNEKHALLFGQNGGLALMTWETEDGQPQLRLSDWRIMRVLYPKKVPTGEVSAKGVPAMAKLGDVWLNHPHRRFYNGIELAPNGHANPGYYNMWRGFSVEPKKGDWSKYRDHLALLVNGDRHCLEYVVTWLAETVKHPDRPIEIAICFKGEQGTGKSTAAKWFGSLFGQHFMHLDSEQRILGHFNAHLHNVILVLADEAVWAGSKAGLGALKRMITEETLAIERKGVDMMVVKNRMHMIVASNEDWFVPVGFDNRRFAVFKTSTTQQNNLKFFRGVHTQLFEQGGLGAMLYDLLEWKGGVDLRDIPQTEELDEQKYRSMHPKEAWWYDVLCDGKIWRDARQEGEEYAVDPEELYGEYARSVSQASRFISLGTKGALGRFLRTALPSPYPLSRQESSGARRRYWVFPPLEGARDFFAMKFWQRQWSSRKMDVEELESLLDHAEREEGV